VIAEPGDDEECQRHIIEIGEIQHPSPPVDSAAILPSLLKSS
jgi:hypothetical protein